MNCSSLLMCSELTLLRRSRLGSCRRILALADLKKSQELIFDFVLISTLPSTRLRILILSNGDEEESSKFVAQM